MDFLYLLLGTLPMLLILAIGLLDTARYRAPMPRLDKPRTLDVHPWEVRRGWTARRL